MSTPDPVADSADGTYTRAEFAARQGWSRSYITKLGHEGRLVLTEDGKRICEADTLQRIADTTAASDRASAGVVPSALQLLQIEEKRLDIARKRREDAREAGELRRADEVAALIADAGTQFRSGLESLAADLAPQLAGITGDEAAVRELLSREFESLLSNLARNFARAAARR